MRGEDLHACLRSIFAKALDVSGGLGKLAEDKPPLPEWLYTLGWGSGQALGVNIAHDTILNAVWALKQSGVQPGHVIIDEGWQDLARNLKDEGSPPSLLSFDADAICFPKGLKGLVEELKDAGVHSVGVWHGMMGSRGGVHPTLAKRYGLSPDNKGRYLLGFDLGKTFEFYHDFYSFLRRQGVDFIKVGDQGRPHSFVPADADVSLLYRNLQTALQAAASLHFNSVHFNTDCLRSENILYWSTARIARTAHNIDFRNPVGAMQAIRNNLANSLWLQHLMVPDFDAWASDTPQSETLAIFHGLSGSFNILSDATKTHNTSLIHKVVLPSGHVLRADTPLQLCKSSIFVNPLKDKEIYKAYTRKGDTFVIGAFNLTGGKRSLQGSVTASDICGIPQGRYAVSSMRNGFVGIFEEHESFKVKLKPNQSDIFTFAPLKDRMAVLGCYGFFLPPGPITEVSYGEDSVHVFSVAAAPLLIYSEREILDVRRNNIAVPWEYDGRRKTLSIDSRQDIQEEPSRYTIRFES